MDKEFFSKLKKHVSSKVKIFFIDKVKKLTYKQKIIIMIVSLLIIISCVFASIAISSSKTIVINKFEKILNSKNPYNVYKYIKTKNASIKIDEKTVKPLVDYLNNNPQRKKELIDILRYQDSSKDLLSLKNENSLFGKRYYIEVSLVKLNFNINLKNTNLYVNEDKVYETKNDNEKFNMETCIPGIYTIKGVYESEYGEFEESQDITAMQNENNINIKLNAINLTVESNYKDSKVFVNDKDTNKTVEQFQDIGPIPSDKDYKIYIEKEFPWGKVKSDEKTIQDVSTIKLEINPLTDELRTKLEAEYENFYNNLFKALTDRNKDEIKNTSEEIKNTLYNKYYENGLIVKNSYKMKNLKWELDNISMKYENQKYKAYAIAEISYEKEKSIIFIPYNKETINKSFMTELTYDENKDVWITTKVEEI